MGKRIRIRAGRVEVIAELNDGPTAKKVYENLPIKGTAETWGDEIYFEIPVEASLESTAQEVVEKGALGYWPTGRAFCIFFGPTPASRGDEIRPASAVNLLGGVTGDTTYLKGVRSGEPVFIDKL